ncbi:MAG: TetR/AcrR family transcriptional regulator [Aestuariivirga sp.]|nr:TetR/AcrR family transcriptional regulator [Aestuariivirga sp.]
MDHKTDPVHTSQQILEIAQRLVQTRGYNAFSYADIASELRVSKASLHYHFASKHELGVKLIERYELGMERALGEIDANGGGAAVKLRRYVDIYAKVLADERMCLCGMLAAEFETLPKAMQTALENFFQLNERWLTGVLNEGRTSGVLRFDGPAAEASQFIIGSLEGSMMMARSKGGMARFDSASRRILTEFGI